MFQTRSWAVRVALVALLAFLNAFASVVRATDGCKACIDCSIAQFEQACCVDPYPWEPAWEYCVPIPNSTSCEVDDACV